MIHFQCSSCGKTVKVHAEHAGKKGRCPNCGEIGTIPATQSADPFDSSEGVPPPTPKSSKPHLDPASTTPVMPEAAPNTSKYKGASLYIGIGVVMLLLVFTIVVTWQLATRPASSTYGDRSANNAVWFRNGGSVRTPDNARFSIQCRTHHDEIAGTSSAYLITNEDKSPLTISRVVYNGEHEAGLAWWWETPHPETLKPILQQKKLPITLSIGESQHFMKYTPWCGGKFNYRKQVVFIDIFTNRGDFRYRDGVLAIKP